MRSVSRFSADISIRDIISGVVTPIIIIATSLSYAVLIFSGPLADSLSLGAGFVLIGAGVGAIVFALGSGLPFAISGPDSKAVAVMASLAAVIADNLLLQGRSEQVGPTVLAALILGTLIVGVTSYIFGALKLGRWIRFMPYPVIGGFMAASGWFLAIGAIRVLAREPITLRLFSDLVAGKHLGQFLIGAAFAVGLHIAQRKKHPLAFPGLLVAGAIGILLGIWASGMPLATAHEQGWLLNLTNSGVSLPAFSLASAFEKIDLQSLINAGGDYVALITVIVATLLLSLMAIEVETRKDVELDHELKLNGLANVMAGATGGMVGTLSVSRTLFSHRMGARHRVSGVVVGALCLLPLAFGPAALRFTPLPILGAILLQLGVSMLDEWLIKGARTMQRADYIQLVIIFLTIVFFDFVAGVIVGIVVACVTFAVNTARIRLIKHGMDRSNFASRVDRSADHAEALRRHGAGIQIMWLHGFIFFGSAHHLLTHIKTALSANGNSRQSLILDFRQVLGIDSSAVMTLVKLLHFSEREDFALVFSGLPPDVENSLRKGGLIGEGSECRVFPDLDAALEWCEERLLATAGDEAQTQRSVEEWLSGELGSSALYNTLQSYLEWIELLPGESVFRQGEPGDSLYLLCSGRVTISFRAPDGQEIRLRSMLGHTLLGEMGVYRDMPRGASVLVDEPTVVYRLSLSSIKRMEQDDPALAHALHKFVVRTLASRLDFANREVAGLQR